MAAIRARYSIAATGEPEGHAERMVLLMGPSQSGKTHLALTFPSPLFIYFDPDTQTLESAPTRVPYIAVSDVKTLEAIGEDIRHGRMSDVVRARPGFEDYTVRTVVADSASFLGQMIERHLDDEGTDGIPRNTERKRLLHRFFLNCAVGAKRKAQGEQYLIVCTVHELELTDIEGKVRGVSTTIAGSFKEDIFRYFSDVLLTRKVGERNPKYVVRTTPPNSYYKTVGMRAVHTPPPVIDNPSYRELARIWQSSEETTDNGNG